MRIFFIDYLGAPYDGSTLMKRGLGGSESAVIYMARELAKLKYDVTVFNRCHGGDAPGVFNEVTYRHLSTLDESDGADVVIASRSVLPFIEAPMSGVIAKARFKAIWLHDTFCQGDAILERLVLENKIDEVFTLSDFHTSYITTCNHGQRRNFEVLKRKIFQTRNGAELYFNEVDVSKKDPDLFVFNASVTKGMVPLLEKVWPQVKLRIPTAKLKVIGGFYELDGKIDDQQQTWKRLVDEHANSGVIFTGIIKQEEVAEILALASFTIYPTTFPETFGISTLESLCYNTPVITNRFGALEETAIEDACYLIDYPIQPNALFPDIDEDSQVSTFVDMVVAAYSDKYLHQQKMYACNKVKEICRWDTIALQWHQHFVKKLGEFLPARTFRAVSKINHDVKKIFKRRFDTSESTFRSLLQNKIAVISPFFNSVELEKCVMSVAQQDYENYHHYLVNDASTDDSAHRLRSIIDSLPSDIQSRISVINNTTNKGALWNQVTTAASLDADTIVMLLDGDDWLVNDNEIFQMYNNLYNDGFEFTYGSCWSIVDNIPLVAQPYPKSVLETKKFREHKFNWNMPYTHLRTFKKNLLDKIDHRKFCDATGEWYKAGGDGALFYELIEKVDAEKIKVVQEIMVNYNDASPLNDFRLNATEQNATANRILKQKTKTILLAIPTAKYIEPETFKSIYDLDIPAGYEVEFQYFYGYNVDQVRNLIASWAQKFDYLFSVDSDIVLPKDALKKMLDADKDVISGLYVQRKPNMRILEIYKQDSNGGISNILPHEIGSPLLEIAACGFGCVLVKSQVINTIGYPQFVYKSALDHKNTVSEDVYFCEKARKHGFKIFADTTIHCGHIGSTSFTTN